MIQAELLLNPSVAPVDEDRLSRQQRALLARLRRGSLTNVEAVVELRILNLTARVSELRQAGIGVKATRIDGGIWSYRLDA